MSPTVHSGNRGSTSTGVPFAHVFAPFTERGEAVLSAMDDVGRFGAGMVRWIVAKAKQRATVNALSRLDDRTLKDIGVQRSEINYIAHQTAHNPGYQHRVAWH